MTRHCDYCRHDAHEGQCVRAIGISRCPCYGRPPEAACPFQHHPFQPADDDPTLCAYDLASATHHHPAHRP